MTPFDTPDISQSIQDLECAMARYRTLVAMHFDSMRIVLDDSQDALAKSRALLDKSRSAPVTFSGWF